MPTDDDFWLLPGALIFFAGFFFGVVLFGAGFFLGTAFFFTVSFLAAGFFFAAGFLGAGFFDFDGFVLDFFLLAMIGEVYHRISIYAPHFPSIIIRHGRYQAGGRLHVHRSSHRWFRIAMLMVLVSSICAAAQAPTTTAIRIGEVARELTDKDVTDLVQVLPAGS